MSLNVSRVFGVYSKSFAIPYQSLFFSTYSFNVERVFSTSFQSIPIASGVKLKFIDLKNFINFSSNLPCNKHPKIKPKQTG